MLLSVFLFLALCLFWISYYIWSKYLKEDKKVINLPSEPVPNPNTDEVLEALNKVAQSIKGTGKEKKETASLMAQLMTNFETLSRQMNDKLGQVAKGMEEPQRQLMLNAVFDSFATHSWKNGEKIPESATIIWKKSPEAEIAEFCAKTIMHTKKPNNKTNIFFRTQMKHLDTNTEDDLILICFTRDPDLDERAIISLNYNKSQYNNLKSSKMNLLECIKEYAEGSACNINNFAQNEVKLLWIEPGIIKKKDNTTWIIEKPIELFCY